MSKKLLAVSIGEFGWELMTIQARARYAAKHGNYDHVTVCTSVPSFDLYRDFAHEFITCDLPGVPLCNHRRITPQQPRINPHWLKTNGTFKKYEETGYDILYPPEEKPDVRNTPTDQTFIRFGNYQKSLSYDVVVHARNRRHMPMNNWAAQHWASLVIRLRKEGLTVASIGLKESSIYVPMSEDCMDIPLSRTMDILASSRIAVGPSSGPMCLASLCGTPHLVWFGGNNYVGSGLRERFSTYWNPLKTQVWPLKLGWRPAVTMVYTYLKSAIGELKMRSEERTKQNPYDKVRVNSKPKQRSVVRNNRADRMNERMAAVRESRRRKAKIAQETSNAQPQVTAKALPAALMDIRPAEPTPQISSASVRPITICVPAGIGDVSWLYSKLSTLRRPMAFQICGSNRPRMQPFAEILPYVTTAAYNGISFKLLRKKGLPGTSSIDTILAAKPGETLHLECNSHLESKQRIEHWIPDMQIDHHYELDLSDTHYEAAANVLPHGSYVCIFTAAERSIKNWRGWNARAWIEFMDLFRKRVADVDFVIVGADWDKNMGSTVEQGGKQLGIRITNLCGQLHIGATVAVIQDAEYLVSFPSGIGILGDICNKPTTMFYPKVLANLIGTYADRSNIESKQFNEILFCSPETLVVWLSNVYKLQEKL